MKKITIIATALIFSLAFTNCSAKKQVVESQTAQSSTTDLDKQIEQLKKEQELKRIKKQFELEDAQMDAEIEAAKTKAQNAQYAQDAYLGQNVYIPCIEESYDKPGEYMGALGIATDQPDITSAQDKAWISASSDVTRRFIGVVTNASTQYAKDVNTRNGQMVKESELEGEVINICKRSIDKYLEPVCRKVQMDSHGSTYSYYIAARISTTKVLDDIINEQDVLTVDADRARFRSFVQGELDKDAAAKAAEKAETQKQLEMLSK